MIVLYIIFGMSLFFLVYPYLIYPLLLKVLTAGSGKSALFENKSNDTPAITLIISAYNEAQFIGEKLQNAVSLEYPAEKLEIMVISDASDDGTDNIVREWSRRDPRIQLLRQNERLGKTAGLNTGVQQAKGEIVVFSDANAMYHPRALQELVRYFENPNIGYVVGAALYNQNDENAATQSEGLYWKFELMLKKMESKFHSVVGGDGAIYAIRKTLYWNLDQDDINDFANPLQIISRGYRGIFNPEAICYEDAASDFRKEYRRKRRIVNRSWRAVTKYLSWFNWRKQFKFLFELFSHKIIRWFSLPIYLLFFFSNLLIIFRTDALFFKFTFAAQLVIFIFAWLGFLLDSQGKDIPKLIYLPYYYFLVNIAGFLGIYDQFRGIKHTTWNHVRGN